MLACTDPLDEPESKNKSNSEDIVMQTFIVLLPLVMHFYAHLSFLAVSSLSLCNETTSVHKDTISSLLHVLSQIEV